MDSRELKALEIAARMRVIRYGAFWLVPSQTGPGQYRVDPDKPHCSCEDFATRQLPCKHVLAVRIVRTRELNERYGVREEPAPIPAEPIPQPRTTYKQNWEAYNRAQRGEKHRFQVLLADLCRGVEEPPPAKTGRPRVPLADAVFASAFKVYSTVSSRRFDCDLQDAHAAGHLSRPIHCNKVNAFLESPDLTPVLRRLIAVSSLPLRSVEAEFAVDSSGFSTSKFARWYDEKYGGEKKRAVWVKCHLACGVRTHIVTAVEIGEFGDVTQFAPLVSATAANFGVREVTADKAYLSNDNLGLVAGMGATAFIPFKVNSGSGEPGSVWERMYHYFQFRREQFLKHYHQRSNVESVFSMLKRKFGDSLRSKTDTAMMNETLCKVLCHNVCVVIQEQEELGITADFWGDDPADEPAVLRFPGVG